MADGNAGYTLPRAIEMGRILGALGFTWFEEPLRQRDGYSGYEHLRGGPRHRAGRRRDPPVAQRRGRAARSAGRRRRPARAGHLRRHRGHAVDRRPGRDPHDPGDAAHVQQRPRHRGRAPGPGLPARPDPVARLGRAVPRGRRRRQPAPRRPAGDADAVQGRLGDGPGRPGAGRRDRRGVPRAITRSRTRSSTPPGHAPLDRVGGGPGRGPRRRSRACPGRASRVDPDVDLGRRRAPARGPQPRAARRTATATTPRSRRGSTTSTPALRGARVGADDVVARARRRRRPTSSRGSRARGFTEADPEYGMVIDLRDWPAALGRSAARPARSRSSTTRPGSTTFLAVMAGAYGWSDDGRYDAWAELYRLPLVRRGRAAPPRRRARRRRARRLRLAVHRRRPRVRDQRRDDPGSPRRGLGTQATLAVLDIAARHGSPDGDPDRVADGSRASMPGSASRRTRCCAAGSRPA